MKIQKIPILFISQYFPPVTHIAAFRILSYVKYFDKEKYDVYVVTRKQDKQREDFNIVEGAQVHYLEASTLVRDLTVYKAQNRFYHKLIALKNKIVFTFFKDESPDFSKKAYQKSLEIIADKKIQIIVTSFGPLSMIILGIKLKKKFNSIIWISDLRDEVASAPKISFFLKPKVNKIEETMMRLADLVVSVSLPIIEGLRSFELYGYKCLEVRNGFDFEPIKDNLDRLTKDSFKIIYAGSFYGAIEPSNFFKALIEFIKKTNAKVQVEIYGGSGGVSVPSELNSIVWVKPRISHQEMVQILPTADAFLLIYPTDERRGVYTGKLFDYLAVERPILALVNPMDVAAELIRDANAGYIVDNSDLEGIIKNLETLYSEWKLGTSLRRNWQVVLKHSRKEQVLRLSKKIEEKLGNING